MFSKTIILFVLSSLLVTKGSASLRTGEIRMGSFGYKCIGECEKGGYDYFWCDAQHPTSPLKGDTNWDYCSKEEGNDYLGERCTNEHACGNHGYKYKWCYTSADRSTWGYCGYNVQTNKP